GTTRDNDAPRAPTTRDRGPLEALVSPSIGVHRHLPCSTDGELWILPEPWKTQKARFPPLLGRRSLRADHRLHRPCDHTGLFEGRSNPESDKSPNMNWPPIERKRLAPYERNLTVIDEQPDPPARVLQSLEHRPLHA